MRQKVLIISTVIMALMLTIPPISADWVFVTNTYDGTFVIDPGGWYSLHAYRSEGYKAEFDFEVIAGGNRDIDFFICDAGNYSLWSDGYTAIVYKLHENVVSYTSNFIYPYSDTWYFVFSNTFSLISSKTVQFTNDLYQWQTLPATPGFGAIILVGLILGVIFTVTIIAIVIVIITTRKKEPTTPPPRTNRYCTNCGAPLTGNETYCSQCGASQQQTS